MMDDDDDAAAGAASRFIHQSDLLDFRDFVSGGSEFRMDLLYDRVLVENHDSKRYS